MKFIFPQNYNFKNKFLGIFDYSTLLINFLWDFLVIFIINIFLNNLTFKIFIFIILCFPLLIFSFSGFYGENIVYVIFYVFKFLLKQKLFLYNKK